MSPSITRVYLSIDLLWQVRDYLIAPFDHVDEDIQSWRNFLNANKRDFKAARPVLIYYNLNCAVSEAFLQSYPYSEVFQAVSHLRTYVRNPYYQIRFNLTAFDYENFHQDFSLFFFHQSDRFRYLHSLNISHQSKLTNISTSEGGKVYAFDATRCTNLANIEALSETPHVILDHTRVSDVTALQNAYSVSLVACRGVKDVSSLRNVHEVVIISCSNVSDVSMLGRVHSLTIYHCPLVIDVSALKDVSRLDISHQLCVQQFLPKDSTLKCLTCPIQFASLLIEFEHKHSMKLLLTDYYEPLPVSSDLFRGWKEVGFKFTNLIELDNQLFNNHLFELQGTGRQQKRPPLCDRLCLIQCINLSSVHHLSFLRYLYLCECNKQLELDFTSFTWLERCAIRYCSMTRIYVDGKIEKLTISYHDASELNVTIFKPLALLYVEFCDYDILIEHACLEEKFAERTCFIATKNVRIK